VINVPAGDTSGFRRMASTEEHYLIIFGTGSDISNVDGTDTRIQSIYGLWDRLSADLIDIDVYGSATIYKRG